ncbi:MAG TPA: hypothetical protein VHN58_04400 [Croceicoccus sp.]|nr:hypothetical protein [Croceicoccus sp.]
MATQPDPPPVTPRPDTVEPVAPPETPPAITPDEQPQIDPSPGPDITEPGPDIVEPDIGPMETPPLD